MSSGSLRPLLCDVVLEAASYSQPPRSSHASRKSVSSIYEGSHRLCWAINFTPHHKRGNRGLTGQLSETFLGGNVQGEVMQAHPVQMTPEADRCSTSGSQLHQHWFRFRDSAAHVAWFVQRKHQQVPTGTNAYDTGLAAICVHMGAVMRDRLVHRSAVFRKQIGEIPKLP